LGSLARAAALLLLLTAVGCGAGDDEAGDATATGTSVEVTFWPEGRAGRELPRVVLECEPAGGSHPRPDEACAALFAEEDALQPVPDDVACTQIYGGAEEGRIAGTLRGAAIDSLFSRNNGCEIDRWDRLAPVLDLS
jgi:Subtilisin inhibitor-like